MIAYLKGIVACKDAYGIVMDVNGVGYALSMSTKALAALPAIGASARVWTYMQVKEDGISLFGFSDEAERDMFEKLINVSGVGPKMAIAALSTYGVTDLAAAIGASDVTLITRIPGVGKKTAQRIVLELQGVLQSEQVPTLGAVEKGSALADASEALSAMGFSSDEVARSLNGIAVDGKEASELIRLALRNMGSR